MKHQIGLVINPIAGMGGRVGLKGTDHVYKKAISMGAKPISLDRAKSFLKEYYKLEPKQDNIEWITCSNEMGQSLFEEEKIDNYSIVYSSKEELTQAEDTKNSCKMFLDKNVDLIIFCGGDGTARDVVSIIDKKIPILGIPSGVKMHSAVFGITPQATAKILHEYINGKLQTGDPLYQLHLSAISHY